MNKLKDKILGGFFSSTMWFGFLIMVINWLNNNTVLIQGLVPDKYDDLVIYVIGIVIWGLRWITTKPVEDKLPSKQKTTDNTLNDALEENNLEDF